MIIKTKIGIAHKEPIICRIYKRKNGDYELIDIEEKFGFELRLGESFKEDDLPNRMKKALNHLIILSGGYVVKEVF